MITSLLALDTVIIKHVLYPEIPTYIFTGSFKLQFMSVLTGYWM